METEHLPRLIRTAFVRGDELIITNKAGQEIRVPFNSVPDLRYKLNFRDRLNFVIEPDGSCLYWESADIHLDFEALLYCVDHDFKAKVDRETANYYRAYGAAIGQVRTAYKIGIDGITGLEPTEVQDIESGRLRARATNLCFYSEEIGISLDRFLDEVAGKVEKVML
jgi:hypothetical protein